MKMSSLINFAGIYKYTISNININMVRNLKLISI